MRRTRFCTLLALCRGLHCAGVGARSHLPRWQRDAIQETILRSRDATRSAADEAVTAEVTRLAGARFATHACARALRARGVT